MVGAIEENEGETTEEIEMETIVEAVTMEDGVTNAARQEGVVVETKEIRPQVVDIETYLEIKGTIIKQK